MHVIASLNDRGITFDTLGGAYLVLLATLVLTITAFVAARRSLVISPNRASRDYGIHFSVSAAAFLTAIILENELLPSDTASLHYVAMPQLGVLLGLHVSIWRRQEPWLVTLGAAANVATIVILVLLGLTTTLLGPAYWIAALLMATLLALLWRGSISTQRGFASARSIYVGSKERPGATRAPQKPWLGLPQWVGLVAASAALAVTNAALEGRGIDEIPLVEVATQAALLLLVTAFVSAVPAGGYWLTRRAWMPELTRFVWLTWIVVGFAMSYGTYLNSLTRA